MGLSLSPQPTTIYYLSVPSWLRWCSTATLVASAGLLCVSLFAYNYHPISWHKFDPFSLAALSFAVFLNLYAFWHLRTERGKADQAFRNTDRT
jgi:hypothetical protein